MLRTAPMKMAELMILREDIDRVLEYIGKKADFQPQQDVSPQPSGEGVHARILERLKDCRAYLGIPDAEEYAASATLPSAADEEAALKLIAAADDLRRRETRCTENSRRLSAAYTEAHAFANLKVSYSELEHLTFLTFRIGKIDPAVFDSLQAALGDRAVLVALGDDKSRILAASSKKGRFALDSELKRFGFVQLEIAKDFKGVPAGVLEGLEKQVQEAGEEAAAVAAEKQAFCGQNREKLLSLLQVFSLETQIAGIRDKLESTQMVFRLSGWIPAEDGPKLMRDLDELTEGRVAIRLYAPSEVPSVQSGQEKVPVRFKHNAFTKSFERMVFSYGAPLYGTIDPTPLVAFFFTLLFGIMFGDLGQGLVFFCLGLVLNTGKVPLLRKWQKFGPIFIGIGCSSMLMGLLTGEFFANGDVLVPFSRWITGFFGAPRDHILHLMPSADSVGKLMMFFGFTLCVGFLINSIGLILNIVNLFSLGKPAQAIFSKTGICGAWFFWYAVFLAVRVAFFGGHPHIADWILLALPLAGLFFASPLTRLLEHEDKVLENGVFAAVIEGVVELLETISTYISNSVSFLRVGAFALSHAVLSYIVFTMTNLVGGAGGLAVMLFGNCVIIVLEGMIVAIQVIRLQYYEFFSKFFTETGREFTPFRFKYKTN